MSCVKKCYENTLEILLHRPITLIKNPVNNNEILLFSKQIVVFNLKSRRFTKTENELLETLNDLTINAINASNSTNIILFGSARVFENSHSHTKPFYAVFDPITMSYVDNINQCALFDKYSFMRRYDKQIIHFSFNNNQFLLISHLHIICIFKMDDKTPFPEKHVKFIMLDKTWSDHCLLISKQSDSKIKLLLFGNRKLIRFNESFYQLTIELNSSNSNDVDIVKSHKLINVCDKWVTGDNVKIPNQLKNYYFKQHMFNMFAFFVGVVCHFDMLCHFDTLHASLICFIPL